MDSFPKLPVAAEHAMSVLEHYSIELADVAAVFEEAACIIGTDGVQALADGAVKCLAKACRHPDLADDAVATRHREVVGQVVGPWDGDPRSWCW